MDTEAMRLGLRQRGINQSTHGKRLIKIQWIKTSYKKKIHKIQKLKGHTYQDIAIDSHSFLRRRKNAASEKPQ